MIQSGFKALQRKYLYDPYVLDGQGKGFPNGGGRFSADSVVQVGEKTCFNTSEHV